MFLWCLGEAKVSFIVRQRGVQLRLAHSWARPAILAAGKDRGGMFFISSVSSLSFTFSLPGLCPWRTYVVTKSLSSVSASALAQCSSFQRCA